MAVKPAILASRRLFLLQGGALAAAAALAAPAHLLAAAKEEAAAADVTPTEDLMREHGVLRRLMLIFDELSGRLQGNGEFPPETLAQSAKLVRGFIQDYHEKDEEDHLFPRLEKAGKLTDLVQILKAQHQAGRKVITAVEGRGTAANLKDRQGREQVRALLVSFNRMYRPHAAWEDTVLYPAFRGVVTPKEFDALGDQFEDREQKLFGKDGFEKIVVEVAGIEKGLGIGELAQFTPKV